MKNHQFADYLEKVDTEKQAEGLLQAYLSAYGFKYFAFTYYSGHIKSGRKLRYHFVSENLRPWHEYYLEQAYADVDRTLEENHAMTLPLFWEVQQQSTQAKNKREQRIRKESIEFGIDKGLSLPVHGPHTDFAILTLHQCRNEKTLINYSVHQFEWLVAAHIFYHFIKKIISLNSTPIQHHELTKREKQCLLFTAQSWRVEQIAKELKISERTVNFHIQNANKKLGTNNKYQAINKYFSE